VRASPRQTVIVAAVIGYAVALFAQALAQQLWIAPSIIKVLVPFANYTMRFPVDITWVTVLVLIGPINAATYALLAGVLRLGWKSLSGS